MVAKHLVQAEDQVASGRRAIIRQHELILNLERDGQDAGEARRLLATFEDLQILHVAGRDRFLKELAESPAQGSERQPLAQGPPEGKRQPHGGSRPPAPGRLHRVRA
jgi:hypothetical protein